MQSVVALEILLASLMLVLLHREVAATTSPGILSAVVAVPHQLHLRPCELVVDRRACSGQQALFVEPPAQQRRGPAAA